MTQCFVCNTKQKYTVKAPIQPFRKTPEIYFSICGFTFQSSFKTWRTDRDKLIQYVHAAGFSCCRLHSWLASSASTILGYTSDSHSLSWNSWVHPASLNFCTKSPIYVSEWTFIVSKQLYLQESAESQLFSLYILGCINLYQICIWLMLSDAKNLQKGCTEISSLHFMLRW